MFYSPMHCFGTRIIIDGAQLDLQKVEVIARERKPHLWFAGDMHGEEFVSTLDPTDLNDTHAIGQVLLSGRIIETLINQDVPHVLQILRLDLMVTIADCDLLNQVLVHVDRAISENPLLSNEGRANFRKTIADKIYKANLKKNSGDLNPEPFARSYGSTRERVTRSLRWYRGLWLI